MGATLREPYGLNECKVSIFHSFVHAKVQQK